MWGICIPCRCKKVGAEVTEGVIIIDIGSSREVAEVTKVT
jgi:hypothetical protein